MNQEAAHFPSNWARIFAVTARIVGRTHDMTHSHPPCPRRHHLCQIRRIHTTKREPGHGCLRGYLPHEIQTGKAAEILGL